MPAQTTRRPSTDLPLLDFVPRISPRFKRPGHLAALADLITRAETEPVRVLVSVPPRHAKTETLLHSIAWLLARHPDWPIGYVSYAADIARSKSRTARDYAALAGVKLREDSAALHEWRTPAGGGLLAAGIGGPLTGHGLKMLIVDDPFKNRREADSVTIRNVVHQWFTSTAMTRVEPGGSVLVVHTRWHEDDLIGRLQGDEEVRWDIVNFPALRLDEETGDEVALWPERWSVPELRKRKSEVLPHDWESLYQGAPKPRQGIIFDELDEAVHVVEQTPAPSAFRRIILAMDFGWTAPGCALVIGDLGGRFVVLDEHYQSRLVFHDARIEAQAREQKQRGQAPGAVTWVYTVKRLIEEWSPHGRAQVFCDPAEPDKIQDLIRNGIAAMNADNEILHGLRGINTALHVVDGRPALTISSRCVNLIREMKAYTRGVDKGGNPTDSPAPGQDDHAIDPLRYGLSELLARSPISPDEPTADPSSRRRGPPTYRGVF